MAQGKNHIWYLINKNQACKEPEKKPQMREYQSIKIHSELTKMVAIAEKGIKTDIINYIPYAQKVSVDTEAIKRPKPNF